MRATPRPTIKAYLDRLTVASQTFVLTSSEEAARLKAECLLAVRSGGDFVDIRTAGGQHFEALITPGVPVFFEVIEVQPRDDDEDERNFFDYEYLDT